MRELDLIKEFSLSINVRGHGNLFEKLIKVWKEYGEVKEKGPFISIKKITNFSRRSLSVYVYSDEPGIFVKETRDNFIIPQLYLIKQKDVLKNQMILFENGTKGIAGVIPPHYREDMELFIDPMGTVEINMAGVPEVEPLFNGNLIYGKGIARSASLVISDILLRYATMNLEIIPFYSSSPGYVSPDLSPPLVIMPLEYEPGSGIIFETGIISFRETREKFLYIAKKWNLIYRKISTSPLNKNYEFLMKNRGIIIYLPVKNLHSTYEKVSMNDIFEISKLLIIYGLEAD